MAEKAGMSASDRARLEELRQRQAEIATEITALEKRLGKKTPAPVSPLAPERFPDLATIAGVALASGAAGVRYANRDDVMLAVLSPGTAVAGTFTRSATRAAPVLWCEERLTALAGGRATQPVAIIVNSGNANAFTGTNGHEAVERIAEATAAAAATTPEHVFMASTGVIGEPLPHERITAKLGELAAACSEDGLARAARAIMTTDTFPKGTTRTVRIGDSEVRISGIAKGSGMIAPDMATMLVFIFTDCAISQPLLQHAVTHLTDRTFNAITVDSDTSTSDTLLVAATGSAAMAPIQTSEDPRLRAFAAALGSVMHDLAIQVVKDGEGATKLVTIHVTGAESDNAARRVGLAIANSPLVKTAVAGEDPNWGRIVMAVGKSGERADRDRLSIRFGALTVAENGWRAPDYNEADAAAYMRGQEIEIGVDLGIAAGAARVWTCDLTKRYIEINADYRS